jgi:hypothetical protein
VPPDRRGGPDGEPSLDPACRGLELARAWLEEMHASGYHDGYEESEGTQAPTAQTRFVDAKPRNERELAALEAFTEPCKLWIPGARELWGDCPVDFEE